VCHSDRVPRPACRRARDRALHRHALPRRERDAGDLHQARADVPGLLGHRGRGPRRRQRQHRRLAGDRAGRGCPGGRGRGARVRRRPGRRDPGRARTLRRDGRRRRQLRLRGPRPVRGGAAQRCRPGDGQPVPRRDREGRHAAAAQVPRQPGALQGRPALLQDPGQRLPLRPAGVPPRRHPGAVPAHLRHGVRQRDGRQGVAGRPCDRRGADDPAQGRPQPPPAPAQLARRLAPPPLPAALQPALALLLPRRRPDPRRPAGDAPVGPRPDPHRRLRPRHRHDDVRDGDHGGGLPGGGLRAAVEGVRLPRGLPAQQPALRGLPAAAEPRERHRPGPAGLPRRPGLARCLAVGLARGRLRRPGAGGQRPRGHARHPGPGARRPDHPRRCVPVAAADPGHPPRAGGAGRGPRRRRGL
ncbi:MAG: dolichol-p-glucose synthetase, (glycosyltransferase), partial [uncultured Nocardioides sp.]